MTSESWDRRKDGRSDEETATALVGGNTREIQACPVFRNRVHELYQKGKVSFNVVHFESLTDVTLDKTNKYTDKGDSFIELYHKESSWNSSPGGLRSGKIEFKIQPKLFEGKSKRPNAKVALKESSINRCISGNQPIIVVLRWNPSEYTEETGNSKWLVLSVEDQKSIGIDTHGYNDSILLREYENRSTGECQYGWRLYEKSALEKYNNQWICWRTFDDAELVEAMLLKIWNDLGNQ